MLLRVDDSTDGFNSCKGLLCDLEWRVFALVPGGRGSLLSVAFLSSGAGCSSGIHFFWEGKRGGVKDHEGDLR